MTNFFWVCFRTCLLCTLKHCATILEIVKGKGIEVRFHGRGKNEASHYCGQCEVSFWVSFWGKVFHLIFPTGRSFQYPIYKGTGEETRCSLYGLRQKAISQFRGICYPGGVQNE